MYVKLSYGQYQMLLHGAGDGNRAPADTRFMPSPAEVLNRALHPAPEVSDTSVGMGHQGRPRDPIDWAKMARGRSEAAGDHGAEPVAVAERPPRAAPAQDAPLA